MRRVNPLSGLAAVGFLFVSAGAQAGFIENTVVTGDGNLFVSDGTYSPPGGLTGVSQMPFDPTPGFYDSSLRGTFPRPGDNLELGLLDGGPNQFQNWLNGVTQATTLQGMVHGTSLMMSGLTPDDWRANNYQLVEDYAGGFLRSIGEMVPDFTMAELEAFVSFNLNLANPSYSGSAAYILSDPNISFVKGSANSLTIGLSAHLDATEFLQPLATLFQITLPAGTQASEVVKYEYGNSGTQYFYGFDCVDSNQDAGDGTTHAENSYSCTVPTPGTVALFALGLVGAGWARRRG